MSTPNTTIISRITTIVENNCDGNDSRFGEMIGKSRSYMSFLRNKEQPNPSYDVLRAICDEFNVREEWLLSGKGEIYKYPQHGYGGENYVEDTISKVEEKITEYERQVTESGASDAHLDLLLEYVQDHAESLSKTLKILRVHLQSDPSNKSQS